MKRLLSALVAVLMLIGVLASCQPPTPEIVEKTVVVEVEVEVEKTVEVEVEVETIVEKEVIVEITPTPPPVSQEAPMLAAKVAAGELPPLQERLPINPLVVGPGLMATKEELPDWQPGQYGGTMRMAHHGAFQPNLFVMAMEAPLESTGISAVDLYANVLESYEVSDDNTTFTFYLRKGLKWSDGVPVTIDDVKFVWEDLYLYEEYGNSARPPGFFRSPSGEDAEFSVLDDWSFQLKFEEPYGQFLFMMARPNGWISYSDSLLKPKHYLEQYHPKYAGEEAIAAMLEEEGLDEDQWTQFFNSQDCTRWEYGRGVECLGFPQLYAWIPLEFSETAIVVERNPYYFKIDTEGKQLPYIDKIISVRVDDVEMEQLKVLAGEVDFHGTVDMAKLPLFLENASTYDYKIVTTCGTHNLQATLFLHPCYDGEVVGPVLKDLRFRQAVNYAINRDEIAESVYLGFVTPITLVPGEFNQDKANALLDEIGMDQLDGEGFRLSPEGEKFTLVLETPGSRADQVLAWELYVAQLGDVGIRVEAQREDRALYDQRTQGNEMQASVWYNTQAQWVDGRSDWAPNSLCCSVWINNYNWYQLDESEREGEEAPGVAPPDWAYRMIEIKDLRKAFVPGSPEDTALYEEARQILHDQLIILPPSEQYTAPFLIRNTLKNVPIGGISIGAHFSGEQWWFDD